MNGDSDQKRRQHCQQNRIRNMAHYQIGKPVPRQRQKVMGNKVVRHKNGKAIPARPGKNVFIQKT